MFQLLTVEALLLLILTDHWTWMKLLLGVLLTTRVTQATHSKEAEQLVV